MAVRVLMVDDSVFVRDVLRHHLECIGCEVVAEAESTTQALDLYRTVKPSLITLDITMPRSGGLGALGLFRTIRAESPPLPILIVSGVAFSEIRKAFLCEGAIDYLTKPFDAESFVKVCCKLAELFPELGRIPQAPQYASVDRRTP